MLELGIWRLAPAACQKDAQTSVAVDVDGHTMTKGFGVWREMGSRFSLSGLVAACAFVVAAGSSTLIGSDRLSAAENQVSFSKDVLPILKDNCAGCHHPGGAGYEKSGVDLTSYKGVMKGTKYGPVIVPGDPDTSNLVLLIEWRTNKAIHMPHGHGQLPAKMRETIREWVREGAKNN